MLVSASWLLSFSSFSDVSFSPAAYAGAASSLVGERYENISDNLDNLGKCYNIYSAESLIRFFINRNVGVTGQIVGIMVLK